jgi:serine/threonine-protein kinase
MSVGLDERLHDLLSQWESSGGGATPEELCADSPELLPELRDCIRRLQATDRQLGQAPTEPPAPNIPGYAVQSLIGRGGMGTVWRAQQAGANRAVALKVISAGEFASPRARARFEREVELAARLNHPHIARVYDTGVHRGLFYYAMELIEGAMPLDQFVESRSLSQREILELMQPICSAVQHAHQMGVIHRDLKPSNILVDRDGQPHLLDFGLAREAWSESSPQITLDDAPGTPAYMSPEQASGDTKRVSTASDEYALGVILYRLLLKRFPHDVDGSGIEVMHRIATTEVTRPRAVDRDFPRDLEAVLLKALSREPSDRYPSADSIARDLALFLDGRPCAPLGRGYITRKFIRRNRTRILASTTVLALLGSAGLVSYFLIEDQQRRAVAANQALKEVNAPHILAYQEHVRGNLKEAEKLYRKSLEFAIEHYGQESVEVMNDRTELFQVLRQLGRPQEAQAFADACDALVPRKLAATQPFDAVWFYGFAETLMVTGNEDHARRVLAQAAPLARKYLPEDDKARQRLLANLDRLSNPPTSRPSPAPSTIPSG